MELGCVTRRDKKRCCVYRVAIERILGGDFRWEQDDFSVVLVNEQYHPNAHEHVRIKDIPLSMICSEFIPLTGRKIFQSAIDADDISGIFVTEKSDGYIIKADSYDELVCYGMFPRYVNPCMLTIKWSNDNARICNFNLSL